MRFPTLIRKGVERPIVAVTIESEHGIRFTADVLVDIGSDITLFPLNLAEYLKIDVSNVADSHVRSALGATAKYRTREVFLELRRPPEVFRWKASVGFIARPMSYGILGTRGFFEFFNLRYHVREHWLNIEPSGPLPQ